jgi:hypothetical protein
MRETAQKDPQKYVLLSGTFLPFFPAGWVRAHSSYFLYLIDLYASPRSGTAALSDTYPLLYAHGKKSARSAL